MLRALAILTGIIQFSFAFHAMKTGRGAMWITIIIVFPVVGCIAYYFMEVFPGTREQRALRRHIHDIGKALDPDGELKRRTEEVAISASVENRAALADECLGKGMFDEAIRLYEGCLEGPHRDDPKILFAISRAYFYNGNTRQAGDVLARLARAHPKFRRDEAQLLGARVHEELGETARALEIYDRLRNTYVGFEAKYRHGRLLKRVGREREAEELFAFIEKNAKRSSLETEQEWVKLARAERETTTA